MGFEASGSREVGIGGIGVRRSGLVVRHIDFQAIRGGSRASRALPGLRRLQNVVLNEKCALPRTPKAPNLGRLKFHAGWSGWTRPPTMAGGRGGLRRACKNWKAGCLGEFRETTIKVCVYIYILIYTEISNVRVSSLDPRKP